MVFSSDVESGLGHLRPEPGGVPLDPVDEARVGCQHVEHLKSFGGNVFMCCKTAASAVISIKLLSIN